MSCEMQQVPLLITVSYDVWPSCAVGNEMKNEFEHVHSNKLVITTDVMVVCYSGCTLGK